ncbi:MAG: ABC transporter permease [bacterium]
MNTLWQDMRFGCRMLRKAPGTSLLAVITLAIGIGANSTVFNMVNSTLLSPLPFKDPLSIMRIVERHRERGVDNGTCSGRNYLDWQTRCQSFESMCLIGARNFTLTGEGKPERIRAFLMSPNVFPTFGLQTVYGRNFLSDEDQPGKNRVVIVSHGMWKDQFGGDPKLLGKNILLDRVPYTVVGILPASMGMLEGEAKIWVPLNQDLIRENRAKRDFVGFGRLKSGVSQKQAQAEMDLITAALATEYPEANTDWSGVVEPSFQQLIRQIGLSFLVLQAAVLFVLLIACSIVASLFLARGQERLREMSIRAAIGASRFRMIRQMLTESVVLAAGGGILGLLVTIWGIDGMASISNPAFATWLERSGVDLNVILYTLVISILTGVLFGIVPAWQISRSNLNETLKEGGRQGISRRHHRWLSTLVVTQISLSLILLIGAGLMITSFIRLQNEPLGFQPDNLLTVWFDLPEIDYPKAPQRIAFYKKALEQLETLPGVESVAAPQVLPVVGQEAVSYRLEGADPHYFKQPHTAQIRKINRDYFKTLRIPLIQGRYFEISDESSENRSVIVNQQFADLYWPGMNPAGKRILLPSLGDRLYEIVGITGDVKNYGMEGGSKPEIYIPFVQDPASSIGLLIRGHRESKQLAPSVRNALERLDPHLPLNMETMDQVISQAMQSRRFISVLLTVFSIVALALSLIGIFGITAYSVSQRQHEIGIRMALGAQAADVIGMILKRGIRLTLAGVVIGLLGALAFTRILTSLLYSLSPTDPATYLVVSCLFLGVSVLACYFPARRAAQTDPIITLRCE